MTNESNPSENRVSPLARALAEADALRTAERMAEAETTSIPAVTEPVAEVAPAAPVPPVLEEPVIPAPVAVTPPAPVAAPTPRRDEGLGVMNRAAAGVPEPLPSYSPEARQVDAAHATRDRNHKLRSLVAVVTAMAATYVVVEGPSNVMDKITGGNTTAAAAVDHPSAHQSHPLKQKNHNHGHEHTTKHEPSSGNTASATDTPSAVLVPYTTGPSQAPTESPSTSPSTSPSESPTQSPTKGTTNSHAGGGADFKVGTLNVQNATQPGSAKKEAALIRKHGFAAVGVAGLKAHRRKALMKNLGKHFGIYPKKPQYGVNNPGVNSLDSIIWDKRQEDFESGSSLQMPYGPHGWLIKIPLAEFKPIGSRRTFEVADTHDPGYAQWAKYRYLDIKQHERDAKAITANKMPLIFLGDFESSYTLQSSGDTTWQNKRRNLARCVMASDGVMLDGYDAYKGRPGCSKQTSRELGTGNVSAFVSPDITVKQYDVISAGSATNVVSMHVELPRGHKSKR